MTVIGAVKAVLTFDLKAVPICIAFGLGVIAGAVGIVGLLKKALSKFRSQTIYLVMGLMIGSFSIRLSLLWISIHSASYSSS